MNLSPDSPIFIGIATWNRPVFVRDAIKSVLAQSFSNFRCIVSDNHSEPENARQVQQFVQELNDPRFSFYQQPENCGENGQCHWFLNQCKEEFFLFLHDDDKLEPDLIEIALTTLQEHTQVSFFTSNQYLFDEQGNVLTEETENYNRWLMRDELVDGIVDEALSRELLRGVFGLSGTIFRAQSLRESGLDDGRDAYPFDFNVMLRQVENNKLAWWDTRKLMGYRWHSGQERRKSFWEYNEHHIYGYRKIIEARQYTGKAESIRKTLLAFTYRRCGFLMMARGQWLKGLCLLKKNVCLDPYNFRAWLYFLFAGFFPFLIKPIWGKKMTFKS